MIYEFLFEQSTLTYMINNLIFEKKIKKTFFIGVATNLSLRYYSNYFTIYRTAF